MAKKNRDFETFLEVRKLLLQKNHICMFNALRNLGAKRPENFGIFLLARHLRFERGLKREMSCILKISVYFRDFNIPKISI